MRVREHHGKHLSEGDRPKLIATRMILNREVRFYSNGEHIADCEVPIDEQFNAEMLRFAHASLLVRQPVGDKAVLWVDATKDPCEVWVHGMTLEQFVQAIRFQIDTRAIDPEMIVDGDPIHAIKRNLDNV